MLRPMIVASGSYFIAAGQIGNLAERQIVLAPPDENVSVLRIEILQQCHQLITQLPGFSIRFR
jgi:hypothetical protein